MFPIINAVLRAVGFLTRLPAPAGAFADPGRSLGRDAWAFPFAGLAAALPSSGFVILGDAIGLSVPTTAIGAIIVLVLVTGALHEDGLADVADGLGGHQPKDRALLIMKDSRIGAYGALALILSLFARISLLADLVAMSERAAALALLLAAAASRGALAWLWSSLPPATQGGLAERAGAPSPGMGLVAAAIGAVLFACPAIVAFGPFAAVLPLVLAGAALLVFRVRLRRRLGGLTGDCLGAGQQIAEIALLAGLAIALRSG